MFNREAMQTLTQEIIGSHEARRLTIASLRQATATQRQATQSQLRGLNSDRQDMAKHQRAALAQGRNNLVQNRRELAQEEAQRKSQVGAWVEEVAANHAEAREEWQKTAAFLQGKRDGGAAAPAHTPAPAQEASEEKATSRPRPVKRRKSSLK